MKCIALDDEPLALSVLKHYVSLIPSLEAKGFFTNPDLARSCLQSEVIDLIILDIEMPDVNGLQFFESLTKKPMVIFSTAYRQYAVEGFELDAVDYILKPIEFERFQRAIQKAHEYHQFLNASQQDLNEMNQDHIFIKSEYSVIKVLLNKISYVETLDDYLRIHIYGQEKSLLTLMPLKTLETMLPANRFVRVHRSYLVALDKVESIRNKKMKIAGREIPVGVTYQKKIKALFR